MSSLHNVLFGEPPVCLGSAPDVLLRQPGPTHQAGPDEIPLLDLFIHAGLWLLHVVFLNPPGNAPQPPPQNGCSMNPFNMTYFSGG